MPTLTIPDLRRHQTPMRPPIVEVHLDEAVERAKEALVAGLEAGAAAAAALPRPAEVARALPTDEARDFGDSVRQGLRERLQDAASALDGTPAAAVGDRLPRRRGPSPVPFIVGGLLLGLTVGLWLATSSMVAPSIRSAFERARTRLGGNDSVDEDMEVLVERYDSPDQPLGSRPEAGLGDYQLETSLPDERPFPEA